MAGRYQYGHDFFKGPAPKIEHGIRPRTWVQVMNQGLNLARVSVCAVAISVS